MENALLLGVRQGSLRHTATAVPKYVTQWHNARVLTNRPPSLLWVSLLLSWAVRAPANDTSTAVCMCGSTGLAGASGGPGRCRVVC